MSPRRSDPTPGPLPIQLDPRLRSRVVPSEVTWGRESEGGVGTLSFNFYWEGGSPIPIFLVGCF